ncbi:MAG: RNA 2',3'-cyclic phosphodiesterase [Sulfurifustis sp.]
MSERLFAALWPDDTVRAALADAAGRLALSGRAVAPRNLHATLVFLGNVDAERRRCIEQAIDGVNAGPFQCVLTHAEWQRRSRIVWLAAEEVPPALGALVASLQSALQACGHAPERRLYRLHVTLARDVARAARRQPIAPIAWSVRDLCLVSSRLGAGGSEYEVVRRWLLG